MLYYMPYYEYEVYSAIFCIIRPVPDVSLYSINFYAHIYMI